MDFLVTAKTDVGLRKKTNQDSLLLRVADTQAGKLCFCVLCDGMGGLEKGELASAELIKAFSTWYDQRLPQLVAEGIEDGTIRTEWTKLVTTTGQKIWDYGAGIGISLGTTVTALLVTQNRYYVMNVGDTRAYEISDCLVQITEDQTYVQNELKKGNITKEEARVHPQRNVLLQCVGASESIFPDMYFGNVVPGVVFMLCCDGFRHEITEEELFTYLNPWQLADKKAMDESCRYLIDLNKYRNETDNITVAVIKTI